MKYFEAYRYVFVSPKWAQNVLLSMLCMFVPVIGPIVLYGYHYEIIEVMHLRGPSQYPDFDLNRLLKYLMRGLWVFLVSLIVALPVSAAAGVLGIAVSIISTLMEGHGSNGEALVVVLVVLVSLLVVVVFVGNVLVFLISVPLTLRAGLMQDFSTAFSLGWVWDFVKKMWVEMVLTALFLGVTAPVIVLAGALLLCVGMYPAGAWVSFAPPYLYHRLYELYLQRGGMAIPLKAE
jgi:hypothetical protein